jgi:ribosomal-protein-alanine N-acetyltransferase
MILFETEKLNIARIASKDKKYFTELFTNPRIIEPIPQKACTENQITVDLMKI